MLASSTATVPSGVHDLKLDSFTAALLAHDHSLETAHIALLSGDFKVRVDDSGRVSSRTLCTSKQTYVTAIKIPVPDPRAPSRSLEIDSAPIHAPPNAAAVGMTRLSSRYNDSSR